MLHLINLPSLHYVVITIISSFYTTIALGHLISKGLLFLLSLMESRLVMEVYQELDRQGEMSKEPKVVVVAIDNLWKR